MKKAWKCTVCGYVHHGDEPPDICPLCGATKDLFEKYEEEASSLQKASDSSQWRCLNCKYIHQGDSPPTVCPVCAAKSDRFEVYSPVASRSETGGTKSRIIIVGAGIAGVSAAEAARKTSAEAEITLLSKEKHLPYYRLNLTRYLAGDVREDNLPIHPEEWYQSSEISLEFGKELCSIDALKKEIVLRDKSTHKYDSLIVTMGSHPFIPPLPGMNRENVISLRTKDDADFILTQCKSNLRTVVIGGGLLGLETAGALAKKGIHVTLLEGHGWLMPRQLNQSAGSLLGDYIASAGITLEINARTKEIIGDDRARGIELQDGRTIPAELVIVTTGVRSNSYVARLAGLDVNRGIVVDNFMKSDQPGIYAAGDVAEHRGVNYGTWGPSQFQGAIAGINAAGGESEFAGIPRSNTLKVLGYDMFSIGQITGEDASYQALENTRDGNYYYFLFRDSYMVGAIMLGDTNLSAQVKKVVENQIDCSPLFNLSPNGADVVNFLKERK